MDEKPEKIPRKQKNESLAVALAPKVPTITHITSFNTPITFNKRTQSLYEWILKHKTNTFGDTPIVVKKDNHFQIIGHVAHLQESNTMMNELACQCGVYIANTHKKYKDSNKKKFTRYGTIFLFGTSKGIFAVKDISEMSMLAPVGGNIFLGHLLVVGPDKFFAEDKNKQEEDSTID